MLQTKKAAAEACAAKCCADIQSSNEAAAVAGYSLELLFVQICAVFRVLIVDWPILLKEAYKFQEVCIELNPIIKRKH